ncbi:acyltransferase [Sinirhodobacter populi]|uniref:Acyltransferase n=1 Tax=Paenirhodobacter populi TaxID=2306993 RepID=A0A443K000_9RHOB|nr:acyltransferase family protein [Sinirhodobacter populi]RWR26049.1 acyltransferase [Sinirhodobacter populi]
MMPIYLKEIQGLRVVAALLVAVYHIWFHRVSGGVDAFFVISGFFLMRGFLKTEVLGWSEIVRYWQRTLARIVPSASIVILTTCVLFALFGTDMLWSNWIKSGIAALLMVENWWLMKNGVDYLSMGQVPTPFQQMWALSVQMQVYFLLPLVIAGAFTLLNRFGAGRLRTPLISALTILSFAYALHATHVDQPAAYFNTAARIWEFLVGSLLALVLAKITMPRRAAKVLGWTSLAVLATFAALIPVAEAFPGLPTLVPVGATVGIIIAAQNGGNIRILTNEPMQWLGNLSFTFYLWHWPLYILVWNRTRSPDVGFALGLGIIIAAFILAVLTWALVERPFRQSRLVNAGPFLAFSVCLLAMAPAGLSVGFWAIHYKLLRSAAIEEQMAVLRGAPSSELVPATLIAREDIPVSYKDGCYQANFERYDLVECSYGNQDGPIVVVLAGGSHALQWLPALQRTATENTELKIVNMIKSGCTFTLTLEGISVDSVPEACLEWNRRAVDRIHEIAPDLVITTGTRVDESGEIIPEGYRAAWMALGDIPILAIRDNPRAQFDIAACVSLYGPDARSCALPRDKNLNDEIFSARNEPPNVTFANLSDVFCGAEVCPPTRDGILIYRDSNHLTATYAANLAPRIADQINRIIDAK